MKRRDFLKSSAISGGALLFPPPARANASEVHNRLQVPAVTVPIPRLTLPDLKPARWLWYPSNRCLSNTFVLFRREIQLQSSPVRAAGWISADSRYRLEVNGERVQWGPAPCDPRWLEADPIDLTGRLHSGINVVGALVLFYGLGDGTSPMGKPGFLFYLEVEYADGKHEAFVSDNAWRSLLARSWKPGHYKRWYLRSLQEEFDARLFPYGWSTSAFKTNEDWLPAMVLDCAANKPPVCSNYTEYQLDMKGDSSSSELRPRSIPSLREEMVPNLRVAEAIWIRWKRSPEEYFECRPPDAYVPERTSCASESAPGEWTVQLDGARGAAITFEWSEQVVGWPYFTILAPAGTVIELMVHEAHKVEGPALLNSHFDSWSRFICREGENRFETFDFESLRWLQLHIHGAPGTIRVRDVGIRRRVFPWPNQPQVRCSDPALQRLFDASLNTLHNCAQETLVDGMARERQQYSGDCGHQTHALYLAFGESRLPARYLTTFSQGMTLDGFFLDCWPAYDRLARLMERQLQLTSWGPILDHGVGFNFDCFYYYLYTGDLEALKEPYPRLLRFAAYLKSLIRFDGLLPVENLGVPSVWIDHNAYRQQRHKQCAFNLYAAAMLQHALAPLCRAFKDSHQEQTVLSLAKGLLAAAIRKFWSPRKNVFINNLPWLSVEGSPRLCDRSLATAILFDQCPGGRIQEAVNLLAECPSEMGFSYPANAGWRLWALAAAGRGDAVVHDLRERWATMDSVLLNNTLQEDWKATTDSNVQWSHCAVVPLYAAYMSLAGIQPLAPGFGRCQIRPQLADLESLELVAQTVRGALTFRAAGRKGKRVLHLALPPGCEAELLVPRQETLQLPSAPEQAPIELRRYRLEPGREIDLLLRHV